jgi:hypothetical protein
MDSPDLDQSMKLAYSEAIKTTFFLMVNLTHDNSEFKHERIFKAYAEVIIFLYV